MVAYGGVIVGSGGAGASRFSFPLLIALILSHSVEPGLADAAQRAARSPNVQRLKSRVLPAAWKASVVVLPAALVVAIVLGQPQRVAGIFSAKHRARLKDLTPDPELLRSSESMQEQTPPGSRILSTSLMNFRLDFKRNEVLINDLPGTVGPRAGWPERADGAALAAYMNARNIDYVAVQKNVLIPPPGAYLRQWTGTAFEKAILDGTYRFLDSLAQEPFASAVVWEDNRHRLYRVPSK
jgi:hypothetical protein